MEIGTLTVHEVLAVDMNGRLDSHTAGDAGDRIVEIAQSENSRVLLNLDKLECQSNAGLRVIQRGTKVFKTIMGNQGFAAPAGGGEGSYGTRVQ